MNRNRLGKIRLFILLMAIHCFVFSPVMTNYSWAENNIHLQRGKSSYDFLEYEQALVELEKALTIEGNSDQDFAQIYKYIGLTHIALGRKDKALDAFKRALQYYSNLEIEYQYSSPKIMEVFNKAKGAAEGVAPDTSPPTIEHIPFAGKAVSGESVKLEAVIYDNDKVRLATLYYKEKWKKTFSAVKMSLSGKDVYSARIPGKIVTTDGTEYYIEAVDVAGNVSTKGNAEFALAIAVKAEAEKKPIYKKWWFWAGSALLVGLAAAGGGGGGGDAAVTTGDITISGPTP